MHCILSWVTEMEFLMNMVFSILAQWIFKINFNNIISTVTGSFFGAGAAFFLNTYHSKKKKRLKNLASLEQTKFIIEKNIAFHKQIKKYLIEKLRTAIIY